MTDNADMLEPVTTLRAEVEVCIAAFDCGKVPLSSSARKIIGKACIHGMQTALTFVEHAVNSGAVSDMQKGVILQKIRDWYKELE